MGQVPHTEGTRGKDQTYVCSMHSFLDEWDDQASTKQVSKDATCTPGHVSAYLKQSSSRDSIHQTNSAHGIPLIALAVLST